MGSSYRHPALKQLKEQQARFAPRERRLEQIDRAEQLLGEIEVGTKLSLRISLLPDHGVPSGGGAGPGARRRRRPARPPAVRRRPLARPSASRSSRRPEPVLTVDAVSRRFNVSTRTITRWRRQGLVARRFIIDGRHQGRVPGVEPVAVRRGAPRAGRPGDPVPATDRRGAGRDRPPRPSHGAGRPGRPGRDRAEDRTQDVTLHRNGPDGPEGLRPRASRPGDLPALDRPARRGGQGADLPALPRAGSRPRSSPASSAGPGRASTGSSTRCVRGGSWSVKLEYMPHPSFDDPAARAEILGPIARAGRRQGPPPDQGPQGAAPLPGRPLRGARC